jgi:hypothetical protein
LKVIRAAIRIHLIAGLRPEAVQPGETHCKAMFRSVALETAILRAPRDDDVLDPGHDLGLLGLRATIEVVGQVPGEAPPLAGRRIRNALALYGPRLGREFSREVTGREPPSPLQP